MNKKDIIDILNDELEADREFNIVLGKEAAAKAIMDKIKEDEKNMIEYPKKGSYAEGILKSLGNH